MDWGHYLFGFDGRINRAKMWLFILVAILAHVVFSAIIFPLSGFSFFGFWYALSHPGATIVTGISSLLVIVLSIGFAILMFFAGLAVTVKRLHDRDKSWVWLIVFYVIPWVLDVHALSHFMFMSYGSDFHSFVWHTEGGLLRLVALILTIWAFVELYCLRGTVGPNQYGPDPLAPQT